MGDRAGPGIYVFKTNPAKEEAPNVEPRRGVENVLSLGSLIDARHG